MDTNKKNVLQVCICLLLILISTALYCWYYQEYVKPKSYVIGNVVEFPYKNLAIKDYIEDEDVLFSINLNDVAFKSDKTTCTYTYNFENKEFNGLLTDYVIFVNDTLITDTQNAGTISGVYQNIYRDVDNNVFNTTDVNINFAFQSASSTMNVSFADENDNLGLMMMYLSKNDFIITICENPFVMNDVYTDDEFGRIECSLNVYDDIKIYTEYNDSLGVVNGSKTILVDRTGSIKVFSVITNDIDNISVVTDGEYTIDFDNESYEYTISWTDVNYLFINVNEVI